MENNKDDILAKVSDLITERVVTFDISIIPQGKWHKLLQRWKIMPTKKSLSIRPVVYGNMVRISKELLSIEAELLKNSSNLEKSLHIISTQGEPIIRAIAIAIQNTRNEPSQALINLLKENLTAMEILSLYAFLMERMDIKSFIATINSIKGLNVLSVEERMAVKLNEESPMIQGS